MKNEKQRNKPRDFSEIDSLIFGDFEIAQFDSNEDTQSPKHVNIQNQYEIKQAISNQNYISPFDLKQLDPKKDS